MSRYRSPSRLGLTVFAVLLCMSLTVGRPSGAGSAESMVNGLWEYTGLVSSAGDEMPLTGIFLFKDGIFVQQAIFNGNPFDQQGAMAHAGPYSSKLGSVHLLAEQTISISPDQQSPLSFRKNTEHDVSVTRSGDHLTLVFGSGTVQEFKRVGPGRGELYLLEDGALAFVDGYFILVQGNADGAVTGYGTFEKHGDHLQLNVIRWAEANESSARNQRETAMEATFDGRSLMLADGRSFSVVR